MAITPYDQAMWSTFTPMSGQEILQPAMMMRERQDALDNEYASLNDMTQQLAFIAENEPDPIIRDRYNNYMAQVEQGMNSIRDRGINPNSRREMLALRSKFQSEMLPMKAGYDLKQQDINIYNQMKLKDPSWIGPDPSQRGVSDYINNGLQPMSQQGVSGEAFAKQAGDMASQFQHILNSADPTPLMVDQFGPQYQEFRRGLDPNTPAHDAAAQYIKQIVLQANMSSLGWAMNENGEIDPSVYSAIDNQMNRGLVNTMGKSEVLRDTGREAKMALEAQKQQARAEAAARGNAVLYPTPIAGEDFSTSNDFDSRLKDLYGKEDKNVIEQLFSKTSGPEGVKIAKREPLGQGATASAKEAKQIFDTISNSSEEELANMLQGLTTSNPEVLKELGIDLNRGTLKESIAKALTQPSVGEGIGSAYVALLKTISPIGLTGDTRKADSSEVAEILASAIQADNTSKTVDKLSATYGAPKEAIVKSMEDYYANLREWSGTSYKYMDNALNSQQERAALDSSRNLRTANATVRRDDGKGSKEVALNKLSKDEIDALQELTANSVQGQFLYHGDPSYKLTKTIKGKTYTVIVPALDLASDQAESKAVYDTLMNGISEPTQIDIPGSAPLIAVPEFSNGQYNVVIIKNGQRYSPEDIFKMGYLNTGRSIYDKSQSITNLGK